MAGPSDVYEMMIERALNQVDIDLESFFRQAEANGMDLDVVEERLTEDLENDGPIFGKFLNNFVGASEGTAMQAFRQGTSLGEIRENPSAREVARMSAEDIDRIIDSGDNEAAQAVVNQVAPVRRVTWIAMLVNTCHRCLPLHGVTLTEAQWKQRGLHPSTIHEGWNSHCHCQLVAEDEAAERSELIDPLVRSVLETRRGLKGNRHTARSVAQRDVDKARERVREAQQSKEGRRTLRLLGSVREEPEQPEQEDQGQ